MKTFAWVMTMIGCVLGGIVVLFGIFGANGAPQQAASAGIGISLAAIPYCFARAVSEVGKS